MDRNAIWKWLILVLLLMGSILSVNQWGINLGIDLAGGYSFVLEVDQVALDAEVRDRLGAEATDDDVEKAKADAATRALEVIRSRIDKVGTREPIIYPEPKSNRIVVQIPGLNKESDADGSEEVSKGEIERIESILTDRAALSFRLVHTNNFALTSALLQKDLTPPGYSIVTVPSPTVGGSPEKLYQRTEEYEGMTETEIARIRTFERPGTLFEFLLQKETVNNGVFYRPFFVSKKIEMEGDSIVRASVDVDNLGRPQVAMSFNSEGSDAFGALTEKNKGRLMAIVLDDTLYSAPRINDAIYGGSATITGSFTMDEVNQLVIVLQAGSLPAPLKVVNRLQVSPTLGEASIRTSMMALACGAIAVLIFMLFYYHVAGVVVSLALIVDALLIPLGMMFAAGILGLFVDLGVGSGEAGLPTLTLPGIAGLILTIGMAVDANVLIFERIREEQRDGKRYTSAVAAGYDKAFSTIFDANITTLIVAVFLFSQGSGPIRGFAVTLTAGILVSMYTALVFTRMIFDFLGRSGKRKSLKMLSIFKETTNFDFLGKRKMAAVLSLTLIVVTMGMFMNGGVKRHLGVDLTSGRSLTVKVDSEPDQVDLEAKLAALGVTDVSVQIQTDAVNNDQRLVVKVVQEEAKAAPEGAAAAVSQGDIAKKYLEETYGAILQDETVGPQVGKEMTRRGIKALLFALIGIVIYVTMRFEFSFALGAILALAHDVLLTVGIFTLLGRQINLPIIAALLTIVGYSANDTIVVFDRIREDLKLFKNKSRDVVANGSINRTLSRTILTSLTTLLTVVMLLVFGGQAINDFALTLFIGILVGTYSSIFVATPAMLFVDKRNQKREAAAAAAAAVATSN